MEYVFLALFLVCAVALLCLLLSDWGAPVADAATRAVRWLERGTVK